MAAKPPISPKRPSNIIRLVIFWIILIAGTLAVLALFNPPQNLQEVPISSVIDRANKGEIAKIEVEGNDVRITPKNADKPTERSVKDGSSSLQEQGLNADADVELTIIPPSATGDILWNMAIISVLTYCV